MKYLFLDASRPRIIGQIGDASLPAEAGPEAFTAFVWDSRQDFAARLTAMLDELLNTRAWTFEMIDRLGVGIGPGSLTGVRVAVAFIRSLAQVGGKPLVGVSLFDWAAATLHRQGRTGPLRLSVPALRDQVFALDLPDRLDGVLTTSQADLPLVSKTAPSPGFPHFGVWYQTPQITLLEPSPEALHGLLSRPVAASFEEMLQIAPHYVIPSIAELNLAVKEG